MQSTTAQRRSLNISHFNALHDAISNLARIDDFDLEKIGEGFFSEVFKATHIQTGQIMVLKKNKDTNTNLNILREVQLMNRLSHPNILKFKGVCVHEGQLHALTDYVNGGDLESLVTTKNIVLSWRQRISLALDIAKGMKYLHSVGIFHRDLSAKNCLVRIDLNRKRNKTYSCIVADLGLAEKIPTTKEELDRLGMVGTPYIMAPEVLTRKPYNEKADVFSYGLILCQLIALVSFDPEQLPRSNDFGLECDLFHNMVFITPPPGSDPDTCLPPPDCFLQLAYDCCKIDPETRPSFPQIVARLEKMYEAAMKDHFQRAFMRKDVFHRVLPASKSPLTSNQTPLIQIKSPMPTRQPKISRTHSDITRELIQHAASVFASSNHDIAINERDPFHNPFGTLEHLDCGRIKFTDAPSLALLELTFDLASFDSLKTSLGFKNSCEETDGRPKSVYTTDHHHHIDQNHLCNVNSPGRCGKRNYRISESGSVSGSSRASCSEEILSQCGDCNLQRALRRAMILSPLGNHITSWWHSHQRDFQGDIADQRYALVYAMSIFSRGLLNVRRSISVPDLSKGSSLFHHVDEESESRILHALDVSCEKSDQADSYFAINGFANLSGNQKQTLQSHDAVLSGLSNHHQEFLLSDDNDASASSLSASECYENGLKLIVKTGEVTRRQRRSGKLPSYNSSPPSKSSNRDSGYEESNIDVSSPFAPTSLHHVSFNIPEED